MNRYPNPKPNKYDWDGEYMPHEHGIYLIGETFSVGIFQWISKKNPEGYDDLKRSPGIYRIRGYCSNPQPVYDRANEICERLNGGVSQRTAMLAYFLCKKSETVRGK